jgi:hypothetical protein
LICALPFCTEITPMVQIATQLPQPTHLVWSTSILTPTGKDTAGELPTRTGL